MNKAFKRSRVFTRVWECEFFKVPRTEDKRGLTYITHGAAYDRYVVPSLVKHFPIASGGCMTIRGVAVIGWRRLSEDIGSLATPRSVEELRDLLSNT